MPVEFRPTGLHKDVLKSVSPIQASSIKKLPVEKLVPILFVRYVDSEPGDVTGKVLVERPLAREYEVQIDLRINLS